MDQLITAEEAAKKLCVAPQTMHNWRCQRRGPAYLKLGRSIRYKIEDLEIFIAQRRIDPEAN